jgi:hypothetical protein
MRSRSPLMNEKVIASSTTIVPCWPPLSACTSAATGSSGCCGPGRMSTVSGSE